MTYEAIEWFTTNLLRLPTKVGSSCELGHSQVKLTSSATESPASRRKNVSGPWGGPGSRWLTIIVPQVSYIRYLLACQKSQRSTPHNIVKSALLWSRVFRRRHLGRRVTAVTCLRWPTVQKKLAYRAGCPTFAMIFYLSYRFCEGSKNIHKVEEWNKNIDITINNYI